MAVIPKTKIEIKKDIEKLKLLFAEEDYSAVVILALDIAYDVKALKDR